MELKGYVGIGQSFEKAHECQELSAKLVDVAARLLLVLQRPAEPEQRHRRGMRVDLDRPATRWGVRVDVEPERLSHAGSPRHPSELGLSRVHGMGAGIETCEVPVERCLARPV